MATTEQEGDPVSAVQAMTEDEIGRAAHAAIKRLLVEQGWADHPWSMDCIKEMKCSGHHPMMAEWEHLGADRQRWFIVQGLAGYEAREAEVNDKDEMIRVGQDLIGSFFLALKPLGLKQIYVADPGRHVTDLIKRAEAAEARVKDLLHGAAVESHEIEQVLGRALGYSWFKDDPSNFPSATEADGVFVGPHTALTLADEAAAKIAALEAERERAGRVRDAARAFFDAEKEWRETGQPDWVVSWQRARFSEAKNALRAALAADPARGATDAAPEAASEPAQGSGGVRR